MPASISTVLFDADGVVQSTRVGWRDKLIGLLDIDRADDAERFLDEVFAAERPTMTGASDFPVALDEVLRRWQVSTPVEEVLAIWTLIDTDQGVVDAVLALRDRGVRCCLATNQQRTRAQSMRATMGYDAVFEAAFYSCELGFAKPDPAFFTAVLDSLGAAPQEVLFVDDTERNVDGARRVGLFAELFARDGGVAELDRILTSYGLLPPG